MNRSVAMACLLAGIAGSAQAVTVEFRIVERQGQLAWNPGAPQTALNDNVLNFAVQARVVGGLPGQSLGNNGFNIIMPGEAETSGDLTPGAISASNGQYTPGDYSDNFDVGNGGVAHVYSYLAGINPSFIGLINTSDGSWTQTTSQDIGLVTGAPIGTNMLHIFGGTGSASSRPATVSGNSAATVAPLDPVLATQYLGANNNFIDVFHFNYTIFNSASRLLNVVLDGATAQTFTQWAKSSGLWGPDAPVNADNIITTGLTVAIIPAPGAAALLGLGGLVAARRRRA